MAAVFFSRTYDEAFDLLVEARDYLADREPIDRRGMTPDDRLVANCEAMRLTSRLTQIMAWLLIQKAVHAGELSSYEAAADEHRLAGQSVCLTRRPVIDISMPRHLQSLLDRSYQLYTRVERLDHMVADQALRQAAGE